MSETKPVAAPSDYNFFQKLVYYAPKPKEVVGNLLKSFQDAPGEISEMQTELIKYGEEAITNAGSNEHNQLRILVTGKTGQGKSTLINGLLGASFAIEGAGAVRCTTEVEEFEKEINGVPVVVFDSPGLQDNMSNEKEYIEKMKQKCKKLSLVLYCTKMTNTRLGDDDKKAMKKLTQAFGQGFWNHAVFVLTFANTERVDRRDDRDINEPLKEPPINDTVAWKLLEKKRFEGRLNLWKKELHKFLINEVEVRSSIANGVPVIPTGDHKATRTNPAPLCLPDRDNWFQVLWETCSFRVKEQDLFLDISSHRMIAVDEGDDGGKQEMSACQSDDQPKKIEDRVGKEVPSTVNALPEPVQHNTEMRKLKHEVQTSEKLEEKVEQNERPKSSVKELRKKFEIQDNESFLKPTSTSSSADKRFSLQLDDVSVSPQNEANKSPAPSRCPPQPPPKPHRLKPQNEVERRPRSATFSMQDESELQSKLSELLCQALFLQGSIANQEFTKESIACEDSSEIIEYEVAPEEGTLDDIQVCKAPNENTPCEDTPQSEDINPNENNSNETAVVKAGIEANGSFNGLENQPLYITNKYATEASINAVEKRFGRPIAEAFRAALQYVKKPGQWFVKVMKKKNRKSVKSN